MASIKISELSPVGAELFQDSESFLNELNGHEMEHVVGGGKKYSFYYNYQVSVQSINGNTINANTFGNVNTAYSYIG